MLVLALPPWPSLCHLSVCATVTTTKGSTIGKFTCAACTGNTIAIIMMHMHQTVLEIGKFMLACVFLTLKWQGSCGGKVVATFDGQSWWPFWSNDCAAASAICAGLLRPLLLLLLMPSKPSFRDQSWTTQRKRCIHSEWQQRQ